MIVSFLRRRPDIASTSEKLNLKDPKQIVVLNAPESFERELATLRNVAILRGLENLNGLEFSLAFVTKKPEVDALATAIANLAPGDAVVWFAWPKKTSKRYKSELTRDAGWKILGKLGFECVRSVAIDEDWSALRFRRVEFIKTMTRDKNRALTAKGRARSATKSGARSAKKKK